MNNLNNQEYSKFECFNFTLAASTHILQLADLTGIQRYPTANKPLNSY